MTKGSLKNIRHLVNGNESLINEKLKTSLKGYNGPIHWISPLSADNYKEYKDREFIDKLGLETQLKFPLNSFWPNNGAVWDGLAKSDQGDIFLIEAKANIPEIVSSACGASALASRSLIQASLNETKAYLNISNDIDWMGRFYQYTNRLAHLYFLRAKNNLPAYMVNIYFINDKEVNGPTSIDEWHGALEVMKIYLGIKRHKLSPYMIDVFIDVEDLYSE